jgi:endonuclease YncB( thermonuclease family)
VDLGGLRTRIEAALASGRLSPWQRQFLIDIRRRFERYGSNTRLSLKQLSKLHEALDDAERSPRLAAQVIPYRPATRPPRRRGRVAGLLAREGRWLAYRFARTFAIMLAIAVVAVIYQAFRQSSGPRLIAPQFSGSGMSRFDRTQGDRVVPKVIHVDPEGAPTSQPEAPQRGGANTPSSGRINRNQFTITDGDTIRLKGAPKGTRLVGFNAPESIEPRCDTEGELGRRAKARLTELVATAELELQKVPCSCPPGTEGTEDCNYGRTCAKLKADGRDVGAVLISEGLAVPFVCGVTSCPPTPRPWCS